MELTGPKPTGTPRQSKPVTERRHNVRLRVHSPAYATVDASAKDAARELNEILDLSEEGMSIQTSSPLEVDRNVNLALDLSETKTKIRTSGKVIWSDSSGRTGIRFPQFPAQSLSQLRQWLFVNVLTAFDHARAWTTGEEVGKTNGSSNGKHSLANIPHTEAPAGGPKASKDNQDLAGLKDLQKQVESGAYDRQTALQRIAEQALTFTRSSGAAIALSESGAMTCVASAGSDAPPLGTPIQASSGFSGECIRSGRSLRCDDSETDDRVDRLACRALGIRSIVAVPIRQGHKVAGLLQVFAAQPYAFNGQDITVLQQLTGTILSAASGGTETPALPEPRRPAPLGVQATQVRPEEVEARPVQSQQVQSQQIQSQQIQPHEMFEPSTSQVMPGAMAGTIAAMSAESRPRLHKVLLAAAAVTFLAALIWLIAPWASSRIKSAQTTSSVPESENTSPKPVTLPAEVNDLAGLRKLAEQGDPAAQFALGARYATGEEVRQDYAEAVRWFTQAADHGHILAQATLGAYYWAGRGVPPDLSKAYFWSALAQAGGDQASKYRVAVLTSRMSRSQILAAQQQADDWLRNHPSANNAPPSQ